MAVMSCSTPTSPTRQETQGSTLALPETSRPCLLVLTSTGSWCAAVGVTDQLMSALSRRAARRQRRRGAAEDADGVRGADGVIRVVKGVTADIVVAVEDVAVAQQAVAVQHVGAVVAAGVGGSPGLAVVVAGVGGALRGAVNVHVADQRRPPEA